MKKQELFEEIFSFSKRLHKEFAEYVAFWEKKTGLKHYKPSKARDKSIDLLIYALKRNIVVNKKCIGKLMDLAEKRMLPPPEENKSATQP